MINLAFQEYQEQKLDFATASENWLEQIEKDNQMKTLNDISKVLFNNRSDLMSQAALTLIEKKVTVHGIQPFFKKRSCVRKKNML